MRVFKYVGTGSGLHTRGIHLPKGKKVEVEDRLTAEALAKRKDVEEVKETTKAKAEDPASETESAKKPDSPKKDAKRA